MFNINDIKLEMLTPGSGVMSEKTELLVHRKTTPYIIFAQGYVGNYELEAAGKHMVMATGDAFFTPPNLPLVITHRLDPARQEMRMRWLHFNVSLWNGIPLDAMYEFPLVVEKRTADKLVKPLRKLSQLRDDLSFAATVRKNELGFKCLKYLLPLLKPRSNMAGFSRYSPRIVPIIDYIRQHLTRRLSIEELAEHGNISRAGLYHLFEATLNVSPHQYINRLRLDLIAEKLRGSDLTIGEIAAELDYPNQFLLSRQFKERYGVSPQLYRKTRAWLYDYPV